MGITATPAAHCQWKETHTNLKGSAAQGPNQNRVSSNPHVLKQEKKSEERLFLIAGIDAILIYCDMNFYWRIFRLGFSAVETLGQFPQAKKKKKKKKSTLRCVLSNLIFWLY